MADKKIRTSKLSKLEAAWVRLRNTTDLNLDNMEPDTYEAIAEMDAAVTSLEDDLRKAKAAAEEVKEACRAVVEAWNQGMLTNAVRHCAVAIKKSS